MAGVTLGAIFLSASVPVPGRGHYFETANPFLIQSAVRQLVVSVIEKKRIVWGGHPSITPMIWAICEDMGVEYSNAVVLYQSEFFADRFPEENAQFRNVILVEEVPGEREASLSIMREKMLSRADLEAAVFIGGMDGVEEEHALFTRFHPDAKVLFVGAPGGAARQLADNDRRLSEKERTDVDFASMFDKQLG